jgi:hypothetical protein
MSRAAIVDVPSFLSEELAVLISPRTPSIDQHHPPFYLPWPLVWVVDLTSAVDIGSPELPDLKGQNIEQVQACSGISISFLLHRLVR